MFASPIAIDRSVANPNLIESPELTTTITNQLTNERRDERTNYSHSQSANRQQWTGTTITNIYYSRWADGAAAAAAAEEGFLIREHAIEITLHATLSYNLSFAYRISHRSHHQQQPLAPGAEYYTDCGPPNSIKDREGTFAYERHRKVSHSVYLSEWGSQTVLDNCVYVTATTEPTTILYYGMA